MYVLTQQKDVAMMNSLSFTQYSELKLYELNLTAEQVFNVIMNGEVQMIDEDFLKFTWLGVEVVTCLMIKTVYTIQKYSINTENSMELKKVNYSDYELACSA